jgi:hypothetical protein
MGWHGESDQCVASHLFISLHSSDSTGRSIDGEGDGGRIETANIVNAKH